MRRSLINLYIQRASDGEEGYAEKLCAQLAERLLYVPTAPQAGDGDSGGVVRVHVLRVQEEHRSIVPVFSTESGYEEWAEKTKHSGGQLSLLGADLAQALGPQSWIRLDEGQENSFELQPHLVQLIADSAPAAPEEGEGTDEFDSPDVSSAPQVASEPDQSQPVIAEATILRATKVSVPEPSEVEQTIEAEAIKSVPSSSVEPPKKKRKFLDFLRTGRD